MTITATLARSLAIASDAHRRLSVRRGDAGESHRAFASASGACPCVATEVGELRASARTSRGGRHPSRGVRLERHDALTGAGPPPGDLQRADRLADGSSTARMGPGGGRRAVRRRRAGRGEPAVSASSSGRLSVRHGWMARPAAAAAGARPQGHTAATESSSEPVDERHRETLRPRCASLVPCGRASARPAAANRQPVRFVADDDAMLRQVRRR